MNNKSGEIRQEETIAAVSTPAGEGGVGMVRLSGAGAADIAKEIFRGAGGKPRHHFETRRVNYGFVVDGEGEKIDEVLLTVMLSPKTYTREDMVEISCHGGALVSRHILERVLSLGARIASPGEFSKRAFLNGRIDLVQAEAIIDLIRSKSQKGWKTAFSHLDGKLSETLSGIEMGLVNIMADLEASIDFPDEEIEIAEDKKILSSITALKKQVGGLASSYDIGRIYREGISVAITGRPNVGKSSLMNALLERDRVIVTPHPGTTRDMVEESLQIEGIEVKIIDTAGVREAMEPAEKMGVERAIMAAFDADIVLLVIDGSEGVTGDDKKLIEKLGAREAPFVIIPVINKSDMEQKPDPWNIDGVDKKMSIKISAKTGAGLDELKKRIAKEIESKGEPLGEGQTLTRERHIEQLKIVIASLERALKAMDEGLSREFIACDLADAKEAMEQLTGKAFDEQVLSKIFDEFCIGK
ncbi:tRNA-5-carboxymethylaminomethyl-2-thiouridine(34)synthesis protein MnmE [hydrothermal vent metagenome]|uniref:tRNA-5-carboxymethylaminomethyl-2-thiouridine(34) synthesis protein MnmE n=1 Tax=hydrothermal vent metagenome TaxID=652676 RepID=A0A3B1CE04_9ZZZZ